MPIKEKKLPGGKWLYKIRPYVHFDDGTVKQTTIHNKNWFGKKGFLEAQRIENQIKSEIFPVGAVYNHAKGTYIKPIEEEKREYEKNDFESTVLESNAFYTETIEENQELIDVLDIWNKVKDDYFSKIEDKNKESTYVTYLNDYNSNIQDSIKKFNGSELDELIKFIYNNISKKKLSNKYKNKILIIVRGIIKIGMEYYGWSSTLLNIIKNYSDSKNVLKSEEIRYITFEQFKIFIKNVKEILWNTFFSLLYYSGMRKGEAMALKWIDINFDNNTITVNKTYTNKTKDEIYKITPPKNLKPRVVFMDDNLRNVLFEWKSYCKSRHICFDENDFVFGGKRPLSTTTISRKNEYYFDKANLSRITIHEFRHSHVSLIINEAIKRNFDMQKTFLMLSKRLGHSLETMQKTYMHLFPEIQNEVVTIIDELNLQDQKQDQNPTFGKELVEIKG